MVKRQDANPGTRFDVVDADRAEGAGVAGMIAVVAHDEVAISWDDAAWIAAAGSRPVVLSHPGVVRIQIRLVEQVAVDVDVGADDAHLLAGQSDDALYVILGLSKGLLRMTISPRFGR